MDTIALSPPAGDILTLIRPKLTWGEGAAAQQDNRVRSCCQCWEVAVPYSLPG